MREGRGSGSPLLPHGDGDDGRSGVGEQPHQLDRLLHILVATEGQAQRQVCFAQLRRALDHKHKHEAARDPPAAEAGAGNGVAQADRKSVV